MPNWTALTEIETRCIRVDKGYRGHNHAQQFRVWINVRSLVITRIHSEMCRNVR